MVRGLQCGARTIFKGCNQTLLSAARDTPIETDVDVLFALAVRKRASDLHLKPQDGDLCARVRVDGLLHRIAIPPRGVAEKLCTRIKVIAAINIEERGLP